MVIVGCIQGALRVHSGGIKGAFRVHLGGTKGACQVHLGCVGRLVFDHESTVYQLPGYTGLFTKQ